MRSPNYVIVEVDQTYINEQIIHGAALVTNNTIESVANINRIAKVVSAPEATILEAGDEIVFHHNILRAVNGYQGEKVHSEYWIKDNLYFIPPAEIFAYKREGKWEAVAPFCFVKPIEALQDTKIFMDRQESTHKGKTKLRGCMKLLNADLRQQGVKENDEIIFSPYSEYEFEIEGELYYKMSTKDVVAIK